MAADMALQHTTGAPRYSVAVRRAHRRPATAKARIRCHNLRDDSAADTTSNMSMAGFTPTTALIANEKRTPAWDAQFRQAAEISYRQLQLLAGAPGYGVYWIDSYNATDNPDPQPAAGRGGGAGENDLLPDSLRPGRDRDVLGPGEHPFPTKYAVRTSALAIEPSLYLEALLRDFAIFGGKIVIRKFDTPRDLMSLPESIIVNCTGLGSKAIFNDDELVPIKGQFTVCVPQPEVNYRASGRMPGATVGASINPRPRRHPGGELHGTR